MVIHFQDQDYPLNEMSLELLKLRLDKGSKEELLSVAIALIDEIGSQLEVMDEEYL